MSASKDERLRARILVKAYPQPSKSYGETVCVAALSEDGQQLLRLYPIRYRRLLPDRRFNRFDLVEMRINIPKDDFRPESRHVDEDSIRIVENGDRISDESKVRLWRSHVAPSLKALHAENKASRRSLGIIRPDPGSIKFFTKPIAEADAEDQAISESLFQQSALFEDPLKPLRKPEFAFGYRFTSDGHPHNHIIHDWEVQAAFFAYRTRYGADANARLLDMYQRDIPSRNLHFIMGTMKAHPSTFIIIGLLRSPISPEDLDKQPQLF